MADSKHGVAEQTGPLAEIDNSTAYDDLGNGDKSAEAGELNFDEYTRGGMGRHLGTYSTIFLM